MKKFALIVFLAVLFLGCQAQNSTRKVVVLGDSYSTFEGCIPEGYACWYYSDGRMGNNCTSADSTWWSIVLRETGDSLLLNSSFSGATICNIGYRGDDYSDRSFVTRAGKDIVSEDGTILCGDTPDIIYIFGGTNDSWAGSPKGELLSKEKWREANLNEALPATCYLLGYLTEKLPGTRIIVIVNSELDEVITEGLLEAGKMFGVETLMLKDVDKQRSHPSISGMRTIADQLEAIL